MINDPISDFLARMRNALMASQKSATVKHSKLLYRLGGILKDSGYINNYFALKKKKFFELVIEFKYNKMGISVINGVKRISKPGLRIYSKSQEIPKVRGGTGVAIISTPKRVDGV